MTIKECYLRGIIPKDLPIIDAHGHLGDYSSIFIRQLPLKEAIAFSNSLGIKQIAASSLTAIGGKLKLGNSELFKSIDQYPDNLLGYVYYNPNYIEESLLDINTYKDHPNFAGVKIHPRDCGAHLLDPGYEPLWELSDKEGIAISCHTWEGEPANSPALFFSIMERYPQMIIILAHCGGTYRGYQDSYRLAHQYPNIYLDINGWLYSATWIEDVIENAGEDRVLFGTDQMFNDPRISLGRIVLSDLTDEQKRKILAGNFLRIMSMRRKKSSQIPNSTGRCR